MRIAISGAQSTGKTTLAHALVEVLENSRVEPEPFRVLRSQLKLVSGPQTMSPQQELALIEHNQRRLTALRAAETVVFDRCALDALAHARVAQNSGNRAFTEEWLTTLGQKTQQALAVVDLLVVVRIDPEIPLALDGVRSTDESYRRLVDEQIAQISHEHPNAHEVRGSTQERVEQIRTLVDAVRPTR